MGRPSKQDLTSVNLAGICRNLRLQNDSKILKTMIYTIIECHADVALFTVSFGDIGGKFDKICGIGLLGILCRQQDVVDKLLRGGAVLRGVQKTDGSRIHNVNTIASINIKNDLPNGVGEYMDIIVELC